MPVTAVELEADASILLGNEGQDDEQRLLLKRVNRHGIVTGMTGTGKTVTLMSLATRLSQMGVPVFLPDVKGDLNRLEKVAPVQYYDLSGNRGQTIMVSVTDMGAPLFARVLGLNDVQKSAVTAMFALARREGMALNTFDDVREVLAEMVARKSDTTFTKTFGTIDTRTVGVIQRTLLELEEADADQFFGKTSFSIDQLMAKSNGRGVISILRAETLIENPTLYSTFLVWMLSRLFRDLPELGDVSKPELVMFLDEAHMLFSDNNSVLEQTVERTVRLIRSKGVGVWPVTQSPADIPENILAQLSNRIQHRLSGSTPGVRRGLNAAADAFPENPALGSTADAIENLGVGEALVSLLGDDGRPTMTTRTKIASVHIDPNAAPVPVDGRRPQLRVIENEPKVVPMVRPEPVIEPVALAPVAEPVAPVAEVLPTAPVSSIGNDFQARFAAMEAERGARTVIGQQFNTTIGSIGEASFHYAAPQAPASAPTAPVEELTLTVTPTARKAKTLALWLVPIFTFATAGFWFASAFLPL